MPKSNTMTEEQKKINMNKAVAKYKAKIKDEEVFCDACRIPVKRLSIFNHNKGKKHIEKSKENNKDYYHNMLELFEKFKTCNSDKDIKDISIQMYYLIQKKDEYFNVKDLD
jgi:hypothetical protein